MSTFQVVEILGDGLIVVRRVDYFDMTAGRAVWAQAKMRKDRKCAGSDRQIHKGDTAWRPIGNQMYRSERLHDDTMTELIEQHRAEETG